MASPRISTLILLAFIAAPTVFADDSLSGLYEGRIGEAAAILKLRVSNTVVSGWITQSDANEIQLKGSLSEGKIVGAAFSRGGAGFFEAYRELDALVIVIREFGAVTGQANDVRVKFSPTEEITSSNQAAPGSAQRDPQLVGNWTSKGRARMGAIVLPVTVQMTLGRDGHYSEISELVTDSKQGEWRSRAGTLEYRPQGGDAWSALGKYQVHDGLLITILPDNEPQVWRREFQDQ